ncbi:hypothetical protein B566_EDAN002057 [Ephemera danica]|nr:hypothetical protein B566_EDAN002057 [Ephemera danica]
MAACEKVLPAENRCKILILGAGMAGLSAGYHLIKNKCSDFKILEARRRIGGRIVGIETGMNHLELGANWIHGVLGNPMFELAMGAGLIDIVQSNHPHTVIAATQAGKQEIYEAYVCFLHRCEEYFLSEYDPPEGIVSVGEHISLETEIYLQKYPPGEDRKMRQLLFNCLLKRETCISGCHSMSDVDLLELGSYTELQGGNIVLPKGYSSILTPVRSVIPDENILLEHEVQEIRWCRQQDCGDDTDDSDKTVTGSEDGAPKTAKNSAVEVICENGARFYCDRVICTLPLGVLKSKSKTLFYPELPPMKQEAIEKLLFGTVDKIFLEYDRPFLNPGITEVMLLWDSEEENQGTVEENWFKKIYSFTKVTETLLLAWVSGREAQYMETLDQDVVAQKCTEILRQYLNDPFVPMPKNCVCRTPGGPTQPSLLPTVLFAGEHTHSNFYSTVHGAFLSGRTAAQDVLAPPECKGISPGEVLLDPEDVSDLSSWVRGIYLD